MIHDVVFDYCGFNENIARLTCNTCQKTLLDRPTTTRWESARDAFLAEHPCVKVRELPR